MSVVIFVPDQMISVSTWGTPGSRLLPGIALMGFLSYYNIAHSIAHEGTVLILESSL